jgi:hypothetical protein
MKVGAEDRNKLIIAIVLMAVAVLSVGYWFMSMGGSPSSAASAAAPVVSALAPRPRGNTRIRTGAKKVAAVRSLDPSLRYDWLRVSEDTKYSGTGRNIFRAQAEIPQPIAPFHDNKAKMPDVPPGPALPPPPPPINLKFFGFASKPGELKKVFLSQGEDVFIAHEGDIVDRRYKVMRISPIAVEIEDVLNNNRQSVPLTQNQ